MGDASAKASDLSIRLDGDVRADGGVAVESGVGIVGQVEDAAVEREGADARAESVCLGGPQGSGGEGDAAGEAVVAAEGGHPRAAAVDIKRDRAAARTVGDGAGEIDVAGITGTDGDRLRAGGRAGDRADAEQAGAGVREIECRICGIEREGGGDGVGTRGLLENARRRARAANHDRAAGDVRRGADVRGKGDAAGVLRAADGDVAGIGRGLRDDEVVGCGGGIGQATSSASGGIGVPEVVGGVPRLHHGAEAVGGAVDIPVEGGGGCGGNREQGAAGEGEVGAECVFRFHEVEFASVQFSVERLERRGRLWIGDWRRSAA